MLYICSLIIFGWSNLWVYCRGCLGGVEFESRTYWAGVDVPVSWLGSGRIVQYVKLKTIGYRIHNFWAISFGLRSGFCTKLPVLVCFCWSRRLVKYMEGTSTTVLVTCCWKPFWYLFGNESSVKQCRGDWFCKRSDQWLFNLLQSVFDHAQHSLPFSDGATIAEEDDYIVWQATPLGMMLRASPIGSYLFTVGEVEQKPSSPMVKLSTTWLWFSHTRASLRGCYLSSHSIEYLRHFCFIFLFFPTKWYFYNTNAQIVYTNAPTQVQ